ncbi:uncharacterized protein LOC107883425 [Acyrthosiphon pisum]|uniref:Uncharacterized protein n=1 Tax=Acyrthosiphon pisum TaxID=7029 RepID=A0A8R2JP79_ACYPI|nr:uncharacterized protein LOC107883425 [Acyrthosiphon pisum]XP_029343050.1 uncharacterized protein LOC107883425 [Acyrthosiphon pisum]|eukprot:XP_016658907.1 PREDICTED: uncharacterized protein LOC107883425 [Acyrthosiphon pisum]
MSQYMPYGGFNWVEPTLNGLNDLDDTSPIGRVYEVDVSYPPRLHSIHNDLPFLPQNSVPHGSKVRKLMATFEKKENYIIHYRNLQQAIKNGLIVEKVHRVIQFDQSDWLAKYIELNTEMRKRARNDFAKEIDNNLNPKKSPGYDDISLKILKELPKKAFILHTYTTLFCAWNTFQNNGNGHKLSCYSNLENHLKMSHHIDRYHSFQVYLNF